jgi:hypothetical protein
VVLRAKGPARIVHLINRSSGLPNNPDNGAIDHIPPAGPVTIRMDVPARPRSVKLAFEKERLSWKFKPGASKNKGGALTVEVPRVRIHAAVLVE